MPREHKLTGLDVGPGATPDGTHVVVISLYSGNDVTGRLVLTEDAASSFVKSYLDALAFVRSRNKGHADA